MVRIMIGCDDDDDNNNNNNNYQQSKKDVTLEVKVARIS